MADSVIQLKCSCKNDPWGKKGSESRAARYAAQTLGDDFKIDEDKEYSEIWFGTYPSLPARVLSPDQDLQEVLDAHAEKLIGKEVIEKFGSTKLPFLPKILSIQKALPLQIHPDKELAAELHKKDPSKYEDANHKPEIAVALTRFETFVGWKPLREIQSLFMGIDTLQRRYFPDSHVHFNAETLRQIVLRILDTSDTHTEEVQDELLALPHAAFGKHSYIKDLLPRLIGQYSKSDPASLVALLTMNYLVLNPGDSIFVPADGIHAYLHGDIVECMARSDNMISVGFCPRAERDDPELFANALTFSPRSPDEALLPSNSFDRATNGKTRIFEPPIDEFNMLLTKLAAGEDESIKALHGPSIVIVTGGEGKMTADGTTYELKEGYVFFVGCNVEVKYEAEKSLEVHRAYCEA
ncbi:MAG: hypothetical protein M1816_002338 [Peltula sp. TS41687]|nr:MAG: hypothetical protein M1816_002338 [Peltula sp. TS41687]